jgi:hypothetical protein
MLLSPPGERLDEGMAAISLADRRTLTAFLSVDWFHATRVAPLTQSFSIASGV